MERGNITLNSLELLDKSGMITVLILASSPLDQGPISLGREHKLIKNSLDSSLNRDQFRIMQCMASTVDDLRKNLLEYSPSIVHFCGHGAGQDGLVFEDDSGNSNPIDGGKLGKLFHLVNNDVKCVVLNACYSEVQARSISEHIDFVAGMRDAIGDAAALKFASGFYEAIWAGQSYDRAFQFGCSAIDTANLPEDHIPIFMTSPRLGGDRLQYSEDTQKIENFLLKFLNSNKDDKAAMTTSGARTLELFGTMPSKEDGLRTYSAVTVKSVTKLKNENVDVFCIARSKLKHDKHHFYITESSGKLLVDWEASYGYWPIPFKTFLALGSQKPISVRVIASLDSYFNYGFNKNYYTSVRLKHLSGDSIHGFIHFSSTEKSRLIKDLYDGGEHRIVVEIMPGESNSCVNILRYVSDSWILPTQTVPGT